MAGRQAGSAAQGSRQRVPAAPALFAGCPGRLACPVHPPSALVRVLDHRRPRRRSSLATKALRASHFASRSPTPPHPNPHPHPASRHAALTGGRAGCPQLSAALGTSCPGSRCFASRAAGPGQPRPRAQQAQRARQAQQQHQRRHRRGRQGCQGMQRRCRRRRQRPARRRRLPARPPSLAAWPLAPLTPLPLPAAPRPPLALQPAPWAAAPGRGRGRARPARHGPPARRAPAGPARHRGGCERPWTPAQHRRHRNRTAPSCGRGAGQAAARPEGQGTQACALCDAGSWPGGPSAASGLACRAGSAQPQRCGRTGEPESRVFLPYSGARRSSLGPTRPKGDLPLRSPQERQARHLAPHLSFCCRSLLSTLIASAGGSVPTGKSRAPAGIVPSRRHHCCPASGAAATCCAASDAAGAAAASVLAPPASAPAISTSQPAPPAIAPPGCSCAAASCAAAAAAAADRLSWMYFWVSASGRSCLLAQRHVMP